MITVLASVVAANDWHTVRWAGHTECIRTTNRIDRWLADGEGYKI